MGDKFKRGAASFYIVAFSTLILVIIAASFAGVIISAVTRSSNDDLSQSAYDAALAGVEDAKLAYSNYRRCLAAGTTISDNYVPDWSKEVTCQDIVYWMQPEHADCDMVGHILGRIPKNSNINNNNEVAISSTTTTEGDEVTYLNEAYTCVEIKTVLDDYRASLSSNNQIKVVKVEFSADGAGQAVNAAQIAAVKFSWYSNRDDASYCYSNFIKTGAEGCSNVAGLSNWRAAFQTATSARVSAPPTMAVQLIQTAGAFNVTDFDVSNGDRTDRATVYLVPTYDSNAANASNYLADNYQGIYNGSDNLLSALQIASTNNRQVSNVPFVTYCDNGSSEFACSVTLQLPGVIDGTRSNETFMFVVTLPYGQPDTDFAMSFCKTVDSCKNSLVGSVTASDVARINGAQVVIDSTGRANDLYRRVEVRLESADTSFAYPIYAIEALRDTGGEAVISKDLVVTSEHGLYR